jgi:hypothetical protein
MQAMGQVKCGKVGLYTGTGDDVALTFTPPHSYLYFQNGIFLRDLMPVIMTQPRGQLIMYNGRLSRKARQDFRHALLDNNISFEEFRKLLYRSINTPERMKVFIDQHETLFDPVPPCKCHMGADKKPDQETPREVKSRIMKMFGFPIPSIETQRNNFEAQKEAEGETAA